MNTAQLFLTSKVPIRTSLVTSKPTTSNKSFDQVLNREKLTVETNLLNTKDKLVDQIALLLNQDSKQNSPTNRQLASLNKLVESLPTKTQEKLMDMLSGMDTSVTSEGLTQLVELINVHSKATKPLSTNVAEESLLIRTIDNFLNVNSDGEQSKASAADVQASDPSEIRELENRLVTIVETISNNSIEEEPSDLIDNQLQMIVTLLRTIRSNIDTTDISQQHLETMTNLSDDLLKLTKTMKNLELTQNNSLLHELNQEVNFFVNSREIEITVDSIQQLSSNVVSKTEIDEKYVAFEKLSEQANMLMDKAMNGMKLDRSEQIQLLKLVEQWVGLEKNISRTVPLTSDQQSESVAKREQAWNHVIQLFRNRSDMHSQQKYQSNSLVTSSELAKWLKNAISNLASDKVSSNTNQFVETTVNSMPVSKLEQFVIHLNNTSSAGVNQEEQLMKEMQSIIKSSNFLTGKGTNQLSLKLRPEHLGDMNIRFTQVNGEMIVKITVTTQLAKEMLEGNIQQLRHMFTPQQVLIEKQEQATVQQEYQPEQQDKQQSFNQQSNQGDNFAEEDKQHSNEDVESSFHQLLMNEKV